MGLTSTGRVVRSGSLLVCSGSLLATIRMWCRQLVDTGIPMVKRCLCESSVGRIDLCCWLLERCQQWETAWYK